MSIPRSRPRLCDNFTNVDKLGCFSQSGVAAISASTSSPMSPILYLVTGGCEFAEDVSRCVVKSISIYDVLHHSSNVNAAIRAIEITDDEHLRRITPAVLGLITERILPLRRSLSYCDDPDKISPVLVALVKFVRVVAGRLMLCPETYTALSQFSFSLNRSHSGALRVCGIELATELVAYRFDGRSVAYHMKRIIDLWTTNGSRFDDAKSKSAQLEFLLRILSNGNLLPLLSSSFVAKILGFVVVVAKSDTKRISDSAKVLLRMIYESFPEQSL